MTYFSSDTPQIFGFSQTSPFLRLDRLQHRASQLLFRTFSWLFYRFIFSLFTDLRQNSKSWLFSHDFFSRHEFATVQYRHVSLHLSSYHVYFLSL